MARILLEALSSATSDSDLAEIEEVCQLLDSLVALQFIAEDVLDKLSQVLFKE